MSINIVQEAINKAGGASIVAKKAGMRRTSVYKWIYEQLPPHRVLFLSNLSGISCHLLRPDIYPAENNVKSS
ncbi:YdaS family helix-turn-helix protein [Acinetobacter brisouii]|uniref:YdaS family helix-turn-helix protein n=1 Tax=Acinetobacter brisouii TaxID=396323 RepID=UPI00124CA122|nr:YdaS family helix-turn-helix protein [Acinetobacter brisouii]